MTIASNPYAPCPVELIVPTVTKKNPMIRREFAATFNRGVPCFMAISIRQKDTNVIPVKRKRTPWAALKLMER